MTTDSEGLAEFFRIIKGKFGKCLEPPSTSVARSLGGMTSITAFDHNARVRRNRSTAHRLPLCRESNGKARRRTGTDE